MGRVRTKLLYRNVIPGSTIDVDPGTFLTLKNHGDPNIGVLGIKKC